ncbi:MAG: AAA family ATPase [Candidatus Thermoplasmatota archaeon]|nr:AAA family ATPase [Candidatus Thermoplasmatota archaeon]
MPFSFKDESKLFVDYYVPDELPHREEELESLKKTFAPMLEKNIPCKAEITGAPGTGKTAVAKLFSKIVAEKAHVKPVYLNCRVVPSGVSAITETIAEFDKEARARGKGFSMHENFKALVKILKEREAHLLLVLDEANILATKEKDFLYLIGRAKEIAKCNISVILIAVYDILHYLDIATQDTFRVMNRINLNIYTEKQLIDIIKQRVELAFYPKSITSASIDLIAKLAAKQGSARIAVELLRGAGWYAINNYLDKITPECVRATQAEIYPFYSYDKLRELSDQEKAYLLAVARKLKVKEEPYATSGEVDNLYLVVCEEYNLEKLSSRTLLRMREKLKEHGFIDTKKSATKEGLTSHIYLTDIPGSVLEEKLEEELKRLAR